MGERETMEGEGVDMVSLLGLRVDTIGGVNDDEISGELVCCGIGENIGIGV